MRNKRRKKADNRRDLLFLFLILVILLAYAFYEGQHKCRGNKGTNKKEILQKKIETKRQDALTPVTPFNHTVE